MLYLYCYISFQETLTTQEDKTATVATVLGVCRGTVIAVRPMVTATYGMDCKTSSSFRLSQLTKPTFNYTRRQRRLFAVAQ